MSRRMYSAARMIKARSTQPSRLRAFLTLGGIRIDYTLDLAISGASFAASGNKSTRAMMTS